MIFAEFLESSFWKNLRGDVPVSVYFDRLKSGDPETIGLAAVSLVAGIVVAYGVLSYLSPAEESTGATKEEKEPEKKDPPRDFTLAQLREFDGSNGKPIYVGLCREVFDVTSAASFYGPGNTYNCFAGREATRAMAKLSFEEADLSSLKDDDFGGFEKQTLEDWYNKFKHYKQYPVVGRVSVPPSGRSFTKAELLATKEGPDASKVPEGRVDAPLYMAINGNVLDVSYGGQEMYGPGAPYYRFVGIDASRALARMSFEPADLASSDLSDLTAEQQKTLADWEKKFLEAKKYPIVGKLVD
jgi:membrane-associated progesterone receptor component